MTAFATKQTVYSADMIAEVAGFGFILAAVYYYYCERQKNLAIKHSDEKDEIIQPIAPSMQMSI